MKATRESDNTRVQLAHVEKEQVDIKADIRIMQHDITAIKESMATKSDIVVLKAEISGVRTEFKTAITDLRSELKTEIANLKNSTIKWIVSLFITSLTVNLAAIGIIVRLLK